MQLKLSQFGNKFVGVRVIELCDMGLKMFVIFVVFYICTADASNQTIDHPENTQTTAVTYINTTRVDGHIQLSTLDILVPNTDSSFNDSLSMTSKFAATQNDAISASNDTEQNNSNSDITNINKNDIEINILTTGPNLELKDKSEIHGSEKLVVLDNVKPDVTKEGVRCKENRNFNNTLEFAEQFENVKESKAVDLPITNSERSNTSDRIYEDNKITHYTTESTTNSSIVAGDRTQTLPTSFNVTNSSYNSTTELVPGTRFDFKSRFDYKIPQQKKPADNTSETTTEHISSTRKYLRYKDRRRFTTKSSSGDNSSTEVSFTTKKYSLFNPKHRHTYFYNKVSTNFSDSTPTVNTKGSLTTSKYQRYRPKHHYLHLDGNDTLPNIKSSENNTETNSSISHINSTIPETSSSNSWYHRYNKNNTKIHHLYPHIQSAELTENNGDNTTFITTDTSSNTTTKTYSKDQAYNANINYKNHHYPHIKMTRTDLNIVDNVITTTDMHLNRGDDTVTKISSSTNVYERFRHNRRPILKKHIASLNETREIQTTTVSSDVETIEMLLRSTNANNDLHLNSEHDTATKISLSTSVYERFRHNRRPILKKHIASLNETREIQTTTISSNAESVTLSNIQVDNINNGTVIKLPSTLFNKRFYGYNYSNLHRNNIKKHNFSTNVNENRLEGSNAEIDKIHNVNITTVSNTHIVENKDFITENKSDNEKDKYKKYHRIFHILPNRFNSNTPRNTQHIATTLRSGNNLTKDNSTDNNDEAVTLSSKHKTYRKRVHMKPQINTKEMTLPYQDTNIEATLYENKDSIAEEAETTTKNLRNKHSMHIRLSPNYYLSTDPDQEEKNNRKYPEQFETPLELTKHSNKDESTDSNSFKSNIDVSNDRYSKLYDQHSEDVVDITTEETEVSSKRSKKNKHKSYSRRIHMRPSTKSYEAEDSEGEVSNTHIVENKDFMTENKSDNEKDKYNKYRRIFHISPNRFNLKTPRNTQHIATTLRSGNNLTKDNSTDNNDEAVTLSSKHKTYRKRVHMKPQINTEKMTLPYKDTNIESSVESTLYKNKDGIAEEAETTTKNLRNKHRSPIRLSPNYYLSTDPDQEEKNNRMYPEQLETPLEITKHRNEDESTDSNSFKSNIDVSNYRNSKLYDQHSEDVVDITTEVSSKRSKKNKHKSYSRRIHMRPSTKSYEAEDSEEEAIDETDQITNINDETLQKEKSNHQTKFVTDITNNNKSTTTDNNQENLYMKNGTHKRKIRQNSSLNAELEKVNESPNVGAKSSEKDIERFFADEAEDDALFITTEEDEEDDLFGYVTDPPDFQVEKVTVSLPKSFFSSRFSEISDNKNINTSRTDNMVYLPEVSNNDRRQMQNHIDDRNSEIIEATSEQVLVTLDPSDWYTIASDIDDENENIQTDVIDSSLTTDNPTITTLNDFTSTSKKSFSEYLDTTTDKIYDITTSTLLTKNETKKSGDEIINQNITLDAILNDTEAYLHYYESTTESLKYQETVITDTTYSKNVKEKPQSTFPNEESENITTNIFETMTDVITTQENIKRDNERIAATEASTELNYENVTVQENKTTTLVATFTELNDQKVTRSAISNMDNNNITLIEASTEVNDVNERHTNIFNNDTVTPFETSTEANDKNEIIQNVNNTITLVKTTTEKNLNENINDTVTLVETSTELKDKIVASWVITNKDNNTVTLAEITTKLNDKNISSQNMDTANSDIFTLAETTTELNDKNVSSQNMYTTNNGIFTLVETTTELNDEDEEDSDVNIDIFTFGEITTELNDKNVSSQNMYTANNGIFTLVETTTELNDEDEEDSDVNIDIFTFGETTTELNDKNVSSQNSDIINDTIVVVETSTKFSSIDVKPKTEETHIISFVKHRKIKIENEDYGKSYFVGEIFGRRANFTIEVTKNGTRYQPSNVSINEDLIHHVLNFTWTSNETITTTISFNLRKISKHYVIDSVQLCFGKDGNVSVWTKNAIQPQRGEGANQVFLEIEKDIKVLFSNVDFRILADLKENVEDLQSEASEEKSNTLLNVQIAIGALIVLCIIVICVSIVLIIVRIARNKQKFITAGL